MKILVIAAILFFGYRLVTKSSSLDSAEGPGVLEEKEDEDFTTYEEIE